LASKTCPPVRVAMAFISLRRASPKRMGKTGAEAVAGGSRW
jgi:hypothetical protein